ncbi:MAG: TonB-dependent receptor, partial [Armatimonadetes bacterium]|nr:TonB-dependent receptor [Armatimonadota bacterium]
QALAAGDELENAVVEASQAVALDPGDASARVTLGILFMAEKDADRAEREFRYALRLAPNLAAARTGLSAVAAQRGRFSQALNEQKAALALDEGSAQARNNLGVALTARGALHAAVAELEQAVRLQPDYAVAHANLAIAYLELNQYARAVQEGERAVQLGDRSAFVHTTLARVYMRQHRFDRALAELRRAEAVNPDYPLQHFYLAELYRLQGRDRDSLRALFRGIALDPGSMVEQRLFARTEGTALGGTNSTIQHNEKSDGRASNGKLSYFISNADSQDNGPRRNDNDHLDFTEGILGYQPGPRQNLVFFSSLIDDRGGRPGRVTDSGPETPRFRSDLNGTDVQLMSRWNLRRGSFLTLKTGYRRLSLLGSDPLETFTLRDFRNREANLFAEARWDARIDRRNGIVSGVSWVRNQRDFEGRFSLIPGPGFASTSEHETPGLLMGYLEWHRRVSDRTDFLIGPYVGTQSGVPNVLLPKFVGRHRLGDDSTLALLAYPIFMERSADLRPVETWARPFDISRLGQDDGGWLMNYEITWQRPWSRAALLTATGFYRRAHRLLIPIVDPDRAGLVSRAFFPRGELMGAELSHEQWLSSRLTGRLFGRIQQTRSLQGGAELPYLPRWVAGLRFDYVDTRGIRSFLTLNYTGSRRHIDFAGGPGRRLGGYVTVDVRAELQLDVRRNLFIEVRDLLDRGPSFYRGFPSNGRTILGGIDHRF